MENTSHMKELEVPAYDVISKPDPISNLRLMRFSVPEQETNVERLFRIERTRVQNWNNRFWTEHNRNFRKEKEEFQNHSVFENLNNTNHKSDEISIFYKDFLDRNWKTHYNYNIEWYKKNIYLSSLALRVHLSRILRYCKLL